MGIDIFDRQTAGLQQFHKLTWNLNASLRDAPNEYIQPDMFDLINSRFLTDGINKDRWQSLVKDYKQLLKPGGWLQMIEIRWEFHSSSDQALPSLTVWSKAYMEALSLMQKDPDITESRLERFARWAGFEQVHKNTRRVLVGNWRPGSHLVRVGCERSSAD